MKRDDLYNTLYRALVLTKHFLGKGYAAWFAIAFPEVREGICNLFKVPLRTRLHFAKDTVESLTSTK